MGHGGQGRKRNRAKARSEVGLWRLPNHQHSKQDRVQDRAYMGLDKSRSGLIIGPPASSSCAAEICRKF